MTAPATPDVVYSEDRARRIRLILYVVLGLGFLLVLVAALTLLTAAQDDEDYAAFALTLAVVALLLLGSTTVSMRLLQARGRPAKRATVVTGVLLVLLGILMSSSWIGLVMPLLGLAVLLVALLPDQDAV